MMCSSFNTNPCPPIITCYNRTNVNGEMDIITFNNKLPSIVRYIPKYNVLIIGEGMNAQIGRDENDKQTEMENI